MGRGTLRAAGQNICGRMGHHLLRRVLKTDNQSSTAAACLALLGRAETGSTLDFLGAKDTLMGTYLGLCNFSSTSVSHNYTVQ